MAVMNMDGIDGSWTLLVILKKVLSLVLRRCGEDFAWLAADRYSFYAKQTLGNSSRGRNAPTQA
jgi:hypothetical protein